MAKMKMLRNENPHPVGIGENKKTLSTFPKNTLFHCPEIKWKANLNSDARRRGKEKKAQRKMQARTGRVKTKNEKSKKAEKKTAKEKEVGEKKRKARRKQHASTQANPSIKHTPTRQKHTTSHCDRPALDPSKYPSHRS